MAKLDWMMLANYAEAPPGGGLVYIMGGAWDTLTIGAPLENAPPNISGVLTGFLVIRVVFHLTETNREHKIEVSLVDEDGAELAQITADFRVDRTPGIPSGWDQGSNFVMPLQGIGLPKFGNYTFNLLVDGNHIGERPFRVLKGY